MDVFLHCFKQGHDSLKEIAIQTLTDLLITYPHILAPPEIDPDATEEDGPKINPLVPRITKMLLKSFHRQDNETLSYLACTAACKLLFFGGLPPLHTAEILKAFAKMYFDPETRSNAALTQELSYFLPVFCHSKLKNAQLMAQTTVPIMTRLLIDREDALEEHMDDMLSWPVITNHLADWTDGRKVFGATEMGEDGKTTTKPEAEEPHISLSIDILTRVLNGSAPKDERKPLLMLFTKVYIAPSPSAKKGDDEVKIHEEQLEALHELVQEAIHDNMGTDATQRNHLVKVEALLAKRLGEAAARANETSVEPTPGPADEDADEMTVQPPAEDALAGATASPKPQPQPRRKAKQPQRTQRNQRSRQSLESTAESSVVDQDEGEDEEEDDETMLAGMQGEGTRIPLEEEEDDGEDTSSTEMPVRKKARVTESDIMDELLDSEMEG